MIEFNPNNLNYAELFTHIGLIVQGKIGLISGHYLYRQFDVFESQNTNFSKINKDNFYRLIWGNDSHELKNLRDKILILAGDNSSSVLNFFEDDFKLLLKKLIFSEEKISVFNRIKKGLYKFTLNYNFINFYLNPEMFKLKKFLTKLKY